MMIVLRLFVAIKVFFSLFFLTTTTTNELEWGTGGLCQIVRTGLGEDMKKGAKRQCSVEEEGECFEGAKSKQHFATFTFRAHERQTVMSNAL